ncbi:tRNA (adenosine(37)-N6)-threonylcarbamoyltransferase complex dimerization subunit type 1 TsaB [soil metagenome]
MLLLALDTATPSVTATVHDATSVLATSSTVDARRHGERVAPMVQQVLALAAVGARDLTDIAVGVGPGPFTGLRVGLMTARTLALVTGARLVGVCTLDVLARAVATQGANADAPFLVACDARRKEVYWAGYDGEGRRVDGPAVDRPVALAARLDAAPGPSAGVFGRGGQLYADVLPAAGGPLDPDAAVLAGAVLTGAVPLLAAEPLYLRRPDVTMPGQQQAQPPDGRLP